MSYYHTEQAYPNQNMNQNKAPTNYLNNNNNMLEPNYPRNTTW